MVFGLLLAALSWMTLRFVFRTNVIKEHFQFKEFQPKSIHTIELKNELSAAN